MCAFCVIALIIYAVALTVLVPPRKGERAMYAVLLVGGLLYLAFMCFVVIAP